MELEMDELVGALSSCSSRYETICSAYAEILRALSRISDLVEAMVKRCFHWMSSYKIDKKEMVAALYIIRWTCPKH